MAVLCWPHWDLFFRSIPEIRISKAGCGVISDEGAGTLAIAQATNCIVACGGSPTGAQSGKGNNGIFGWVNCAPETLRAHAQGELERLGFWRGHLSLEAYGLARNAATEVGSGPTRTPEAKVALMLSTLAQAKKRGTPLMDVLLGAGSGLPRKFGRIHGVIRDGVSPVGSCTEVCTRPGRRFTATSQDPTVRDILLADFVLRGEAGRPGSGSDFARGADDQASASVVDVISQANGRKYWVGPIAGVDPQKQMFMRHMPSIAPSSAEGRALIQQGLAVSRGEIRGTVEPNCRETKPVFQGHPFLAALGAIAVSAAVGYLAPRFFPVQVTEYATRL